MAKTLTTALFPVAGIGRRLLPMTKAVSKELLPVGGLPLIQHAVNEAKQAGIKRFIFVAGDNLPQIKSYFSPSQKLEALLAARQAEAELCILRDLVLDNAAYVHQAEPLGLGHAIGCASALIDEAFAVLLPDDLLSARPSVLAQMIKAWQETDGNMVAIEEVPIVETSRYGIMAPAQKQGRIITAQHVVEKPKIDPPSNFALIGRYILQPSIFARLAKTAIDTIGEIQITDAIAQEMKTTKLYGYLYQGQRFDCGTRESFINTQKTFV